jgi:hypothetical protein
MATRVFGADQCNRRTPLGLDFPRSEPCLSSSICWLIQLEIGATRARSGDDVGTHGGSERAGRWAGLGVMTEEEAFQLRDRQVVLDTFEIEARRFFPRYWGSETEVDITERKMQFLRATLYDVGGGSQFGEMEILGTLHVTLSRAEYGSYINVVGNYGPDITGPCSRLVS